MHNTIKPKYYIVLFLLLTVCGCSKKTSTFSAEKQKVRLTFQIIPEDTENNWYYVEWNDTLGQSQNYDIIKRPHEIWCLVTNRSNDTLGYYKGLSTAQTYANFHLTDSVIVLNFMIGLNFFSNAPKKERKKDFESGRFPITFQPLEMNIKKDIRKEFTVELVEK